VRESGGDRRGLSDEELTALDGYSLDDYAILNKALRGDLPAEDLRIPQPYIETINSALSKLPDFPGRVRRGTNMPAKELRRHQAGSEISYAGYTSASLGEGFRQDVRIELESRTGKLIEFVSAFPWEREILFAPGKRFRVTERIDIAGKTYLRMPELQEEQ